MEQLKKIINRFDEVLLQAASKVRVNELQQRVETDYLSYKVYWENKL